MSYRIENLIDNDDVTRLWPHEGTRDCGPFSAIQWERDLSVTAASAQAAFFASEMDVCRRQLVCDLSVAPVKLQAGMMQMTVGEAEVSTGVKGILDLAHKLARAAATDESVVKPEYVGTGTVLCEPTFKHLVCLSLAEFGGSIVVDDGTFAACEASVKESLKRPDTVGAALAGNEGLFKLRLDGTGHVVLESPCPKNELIVIRLENDVLRLDGNLALAWTSTLKFGVERAGKSLIGSATSGEGLVNTYRGTGTILMTPTQPVTTNGLGE